MSEARPDICNRLCPVKKRWLEDPDGFSSTPGGYEPNLNFIANADRICPGVEISLEDDNVAELIVINDDGKVTLPLEALEFYCQYYEAAYPYL